MIFSATVPEYIQQIAIKKFKNPLLIDLVGTDQDQIPDRIRNVCVIAQDEKHKLAMIK
jgi:superfamily II DNA/RNA helicase